VTFSDNVTACQYFWKWQLSDWPFQMMSQSDNTFRHCQSLTAVLSLGHRLCEFRLKEWLTTSLSAIVVLEVVIIIDIQTKFLPQLSAYLPLICLDGRHGRHGRHGRPGRQFLASLKLFFSIKLKLFMTVVNFMLVQTLLLFSLCFLYN
jgi:hypothetical protein